jgi:ActR/RegA family two-component response regulator
MTEDTANAMHGRKSLRVLIAEDEFLVGTLLEESLLERGHLVVKLCSSYRSLEEACRTLHFDVAVLDINLAGKMVFPIAQMLYADRKAFILVTGYGSQSIPESLRRVKIVAKPCSFDLVEKEMLHAYKSCSAAADEASQYPTLTLGDLLYSKCEALQQEAEWVKLVRSVADGDQNALLALYDRACDVVFTLAQRICLDYDAAEEITLNVFADAIQLASAFNEVNETVVAWMMNLTRGHAIPHIQRSTVAKSESGKDVLRPAPALRARLAQRLDADPRLAIPLAWSPGWEDVAPGIECKLLADDPERSRVSMLVRLAPDASYPPHIHAGPEKLHLLDGELWINDTKLVPGDYNCGSPGGRDDRVWSPTGCTCVLVTSSKDILRPGTPERQTSSSA